VKENLNSETGKVVVVVSCKIHANVHKAFLRILEGFLGFDRGALEQMLQVRLHQFQGNVAVPEIGGHDQQGLLRAPGRETSKPKDCPGQVRF